MSTELHIQNMEREYEVLKGVVFDICTTLRDCYRDTKNDVLYEKFDELRKELDNLFPKRRQGGGKS